MRPFISAALLLSLLKRAPQSGQRVERFFTQTAGERQSGRVARTQDIKLRR